jgi:hypothetical protein
MKCELRPCSSIGVHISAIDDRPPDLYAGEHPKRFISQFNESHIVGVDFLENLVFAAT